MTHEGFYLGKVKNLYTLTEASTKPGFSKISRRLKHVPCHHQWGDFEFDWQGTLDLPRDAARWRAAAVRSDPAPNLAARSVAGRRAKAVV